MTSGFGILISQAYGVKDEKRLRHYVAMSTYLCVILAIIMTTGLLLANGWILTTMNTPEKIYADTWKYIAIIYAGLPATERHAHSLPVDYLPAGLDATIAGSYLDLKFTNTFSQPLLIQASANGGTLTVTLVLQ